MTITTAAASASGAAMFRKIDEGVRAAFPAARVHVFGSGATGLALKGDVTYAENNLSDADRAATPLELNGEEDTFVYTIKVDATF